MYLLSPTFGPTAYRHNNSSTPRGQTLIQLSIRTMDEVIVTFLPEDVMRLAPDIFLHPAEELVASSDPESSPQRWEAQQRPLIDYLIIHFRLVCTYIYIG